MKKYLLLILAASSSLHAATFNVSTTTELRVALTTAATNSEDDTIMLADGVYKTTDDGKGSFEYNSFEDQSLDLIGESQEGVVLDGSGLDRVMKIVNDGSMDVYIKRITFKNGYVNSDGGGLFLSTYIDNVYIDECGFSANSADKGGALALPKFINGHVVTNSIFEDNTASFGSAISGKVKEISNSIFINNTYNYGVIYFPSDLIIVNSLFVNNTGGQNGMIRPIASTRLTVINTFFNKNTLPEIAEDDNSNNITLINNFINVNNFEQFVFNENNIFHESDVNFIDSDLNNFNLSIDSDLIDAGTRNISEYLELLYDRAGNPRLSGSSIDIGPYEYSTTRPTINSVEFTGTAKEQNELYFLVDYTLVNDRYVSDVSYDFLNDGNYSIENSYTYNTAGTYTVGVKVTDNEGEFSITTTKVTIAELPFDEMTYEQKLIKAIPTEYYDALMSEISSDKSDAIETAKQYVQNNLEEFGLVTVAAKDAAVTIATASGIAIGKQYVKDNLTEFGLVTVEAKDTAVTTATASGIVIGKQYVKDNLTEFGLVTVEAKDTAVTTATASGIAIGKQYVKDNLTEFGLVTVEAKDTAVTTATASGIGIGKQLIITDPTAFGIDVVIPLDNAEIESLPEGWKMISVPTKIEDMSVFDGAKIVWYFDGSEGIWSAYSSNQDIIAELQEQSIDILTNIKAGSGVFIEL